MAIKTFKVSPIALFQSCLVLFVSFTAFNTYVYDFRNKRLFWNKETTENLVDRQLEVDIALNKKRIARTDEKLKTANENEKKSLTDTKTVLENNLAELEAMLKK